MRERFLKGLLLGLVITLIIGIVLPITIFSDNSDEFTIGFWSGLSHYICWLGIICLSFGVVVAILPSIVADRILSIGFVFASLIYIQGFILVWNYGLLDGNDIDWWSLGAPLWIDIAVWIALVVLGMFFWRRFNSFYNTMLFVLLFLAVSNIFIAYPKISKRLISPSQFSDAKSLFELSPDRNVIQIVLDAFESPAFDYILKQDSNYNEMFEDFTYFRDSLASFPTTAASIPVILSGRVYDNSIPIKDFLSDALPHSLPSFLRDNGSQVSLVTLSHYCQFIKSDLCLPLDQVNQRDFSKIEQLQYARLLDLSLFRALPHPLKPFIYNDQLWFLERFMQSRKGPPSHINSIEFVNLFERQVKIGQAKSAYTFIHLLIPHTPLALDRECNYTKKFSRLTPPNLAEQSRCALFLTNKILVRIKELGLWENSMVVISADHGVRVNFGHYKKIKGIPDIAKALPILLVKPFGKHGHLKRSNAPGMLLDLSNTIATELGLAHNFPGSSLFELKEGQKRERIFRHYSWKHEFWEKDFLPPMTEYVVNGDSWNVASWSRSEPLLDVKQ